MAELKEIAGNLIKGKAPEVKELVQKVLDEVWMQKRFLIKDW